MEGTNRMSQKKTQEQLLTLDMDFGEALERFAKVNTKDLSEMDVDEVEDTQPIPGVATPFVKWVGGKRSIIDSLKLRLPPSFNEYWEPFVGGGALFFELRSTLTKTPHLSDTNFDLVMAYKAVQRDLDALIERLKAHAAKHSETYYYEIRAQHNLQDPLDIAARFIYLNKTCYNGLYRVNSRGEFNVPFGRYTNPGIVQEDNLRAVHKALQEVDIRYGGFEEINPQPGDFAYFDPPYHPTDDTSFTKYHKLDFSEKDQTKLRDFAVELHRRGVKVMLSNSDTRFIRDLFSAKYFTISEVMAPRFVNCKPNKRNAVSELIITNY